MADKVDPCIHIVVSTEHDARRAVIVLFVLDHGGRRSRIWRVDEIVDVRRGPVDHAALLAVQDGGSREGCL